MRNIIKPPFINRSLKRMNSIIAVQADSFEKLNLEIDTTMMIALEAQSQGHSLFHYTPENLTYNCGKLSANGSFFKINKNTISCEDKITLDLSQANFLLVRQNPPFDSKYLTNLLVLDHLPSNVKAVNDPRGIRIISEKLFTLGFPDLIPPTITTCDVKEARLFVNEHQQAVIKPIFEFGGHGVLFLHYLDTNLEAILELYKAIYPSGFIIQKYLPQVKSGDKRIAVINGRPVAAFIRRPQDRQIRSNTRVGGEVMSSNLTKRDFEICEALAPFLKKWGIHFAGLDVIGNYLTEVNVTSPTGFHSIQKLYNINAARIFWEQLKNA